MQGINPYKYTLSDTEFYKYHILAKRLGGAKHPHIMQWVNDITLHKPILNRMGGSLEDLKRAVKGKRVLEIGCGAFPMNELLQDLGAKEAVGTETNEHIKNLSNSRRLKIYNIHNKSDFDELQTKKFDLIYSLRVFQEDVGIANPEAWLRYYTKLLNAGGHMIHQAKSSDLNIYPEMLNRIRYKTLLHSPGYGGTLHIKKRF